MTIPRHLPPAVLGVLAFAVVCAGPPSSLEPSLLALFASTLWWIGVSTRPSGPFWRSLAILAAPALLAFVPVAMAAMQYGRDDLAAMALMGTLALALPILLASGLGGLLLVMRTAEADRAAARVRAPSAADPDADPG